MNTISKVQQVQLAYVAAIFGRGECSANSIDGIPPLDFDAIEARGLYSVCSEYLQLSTGKCEGLGAADLTLIASILADGKLPRGKALDELIAAAFALWRKSNPIRTRRKQISLTNFLRKQAHEILNAAPFQPITFNKALRKWMPTC